MVFDRLVIRARQVVLVVEVGVEIVAELPHTGTGKVQKGRLRGHERRRALGLLE